MEGIIVVDKKDACLDCQFCREIQEGYEDCCTLKIDEKDSELFKMIDADYCQEVPNWCPIKPLPKKMKVCGKYPQPDGIVPSYKIGWNKCIDEILKGDKINERNDNHQQ